MGGNSQSYWAPIATLMSGSGRGSWFMPEKGDEVLVAFEHNDADYPFVVGFLWNGKEKPPETNTHKRLIKSVKGHTILLDDSDGSEKIELTTGGGLKITMDDINQIITIKASQKVTVEAPEVAVDSNKVAVGQGAGYSAVLGEALVGYLSTLVGDIQAHTHIGQSAVGPVTVTPSPGPFNPPVSANLLSHIVKEA